MTFNSEVGWHHWRAAFEYANAMAGYESVRYRVHKRGARWVAEPAYIRTSKHYPELYKILVEDAPEDFPEFVLPDLRYECRGGIVKSHVCTCLAPGMNYCEVHDG